MARFWLSATLSLLILSCQKPQQQEVAAQQQASDVSPHQVKWTNLNDGSFVATYRTELLDEPAITRCWKVAGRFYCLLVTGDDKVPSGWWAWRQPSSELTTAFDSGQSDEGYSCYGGGKRNAGVTIGELIGSASHSIDNQYVQPPAHQPWSREYVEATVGRNGVDTYFDCPALDRFITKYGIAALHSNRTLPRLF